MQACAEKHVKDALQNQHRAEAAATEELTEVQSALRFLTALDKCPGACNIPFEHSGIAMLLLPCKSVHCLMQCRWLCGH